MPSSYKAGGSAGALTIQVAAKRDAGCVLVLRRLTIRLDGLTADQVRVQRAAAGTFRDVEVVDSGDGVRVTDAAADPAPLCRGRTSAGRYRITFLAGAPGGKATFVAEAFSARGERLGRDSESRRVIGGPALPTPTPTPSPTPEATAVVAAATAPATPPAVAPQAAKPADDGLGLGAVVMGLGVLMVGIGAALLVMLARRSRVVDDGPGEEPTLVLPTWRN
jgi:hypothetical protein